MTENKEDQLKPHHYDGIQEYDNQLPLWWVGTFVLTVIFALGYWLYYETYHVGPTTAVELARDTDEIVAKSKNASKDQKPIDENKVIALQSRSDVMSDAKDVFARNCVVCHGVGAGGIIGPNLTDEYWLHGGKPAQIEKVITEGVLEKGMLSWKATLSADQIQSLVAYILSLKGSNPPNPKAPQGDKIQ